MIVHCTHDEAVNILKNAGDLIMLTVKYYRAATPFLKKDGKLGEHQTMITTFLIWPRNLVSAETQLIPKIRNGYFELEPFHCSHTQL